MLDADADEAAWRRPEVQNAAAGAFQQRVDGSCRMPNIPAAWDILHTGWKEQVWESVQELEQTLEEEV